MLVSHRPASPRWSTKNDDLCQSVFAINSNKTKMAIAGSACSVSGRQNQLTNSAMSPVAFYCSTPAPRRSRAVCASNCD